MNDQQLTAFRDWAKGCTKRFGDSKDVLGPAGELWHLHSKLAGVLDVILLYREALKLSGDPQETTTRDA